MKKVILLLLLTSMTPVWSSTEKVDDPVIAYVRYGGSWIPLTKLISVHKSGTISVWNQLGEISFSLTESEMQRVLDSFKESKIDMVLPSRIYATPDAPTMKISVSLDESYTLTARYPTEMLPATQNESISKEGRQRNENYKRFLRIWDTCIEVFDEVLARKNESVDGLVEKRRKAVNRPMQPIQGDK